MKILSGITIVALLICFAVGPAFARAEDEILITEDIESGGFGGPVIKLSEINGESALLIGGCGGWFINHSFLVGGGAFGLVSDVNAPLTGDNGEKLEYEMGYGGLVLEYVNSSHKLIHYTVSTLIGAGEVSYHKSNNLDETHKYADDTFFILEPGVNLELNVSSSFRIEFGLGYRYIDGVQLEGTTEDDLSGIIANLGFKFGAF